MKKTKNQRKKISYEELAEANIYPHGLTKAEKVMEDEAFLVYRKKRLLEMTENQKIVSRLMQLKFELEDYLASPGYNPSRSFSYFLNEYLKIIDRKKKSFAEEIQIHETKLSQVLNDRVEPNEKLFIRLEIHSNNIFPAFYWFKLIEKRKEFELITDKLLRAKERQFVTNRIKLGL